MLELRALRALDRVIADEALVSHRTVHRALHVARALGLIEMQENVIRIVSPEWQALLFGEGGSAITAREP